MEPLSTTDINSTNTTLDDTENAMTNILSSPFINKTVYNVCNPSALMLIFIILNFLLTRKRKPSQPKTKTKTVQTLQWLKLVLTLCMVYMISTPLGRQDECDDGSTPQNHNLSIHSYDDVFSFVLSPVGSYILVASLMFLENIFVWNIAISLMVFWCATLASLSITFLIKKDTRNDNTDVLHMCFVLFQCVSFLFTKPEPKKEDTGKYVHPKSRANWLSNALLFWTFDVIWAGSKRSLKETDLPPLLESDRSSKIMAKFERFWKIEQCKQDIDEEFRNRENAEYDDNADSFDINSKKARKPIISGSGSTIKPDKGRISLIKILIQTFGLKFIVMHFVVGSFQLAHFVGPVLLSHFVNHIQNRDTEHWTIGLRIVLTIFIFNSFKTVFNHRAMCAINQYQKRIRLTLMLTVVKKSLTMKNECAKDLTSGEIVNMIAHDCDQITSMGTRLFILLACPISMLLAMYLLYVNVGSAMYVGFLIMILFMPLNKLIGTKLREILGRIKECNDSSTKIINEIVNGIQVLKLYAWEPSFISRVHDIRKDNVQMNASLSALHAGANSMFEGIPFLVKLSAFGIYLIFDGHIDAAKGFGSMHLFYMLNEPLSILAIHVPSFVEAFSALKRIDNYLNREDIPIDVVSQRRKGDSAVVIENGMFSWERNGKEDKRHILRNVNVDIPKGGLVAVVGLVGAGKSSLLSAILGEMEMIEGDVEVQGRTAYVPQEAWILNASLRDNILFGFQYATRKYKNILSACDMKEDVNKMAAGDLTEIGEKGINLSGGQKQRVSLARAVYSDADVYLLDDPLSAVDAHVGKHIFQKVIGHKGLLKDKTRVLVTHGIHWLPFVDSIIVVKDGNITETGTYEQLTLFDGDFSQFARQNLANSEKTTKSSTVNNVRQQIFMRLNSLNENMCSPEIKSDKENPFLNDIHSKKALGESSNNDSTNSDESNNNDDGGDVGDDVGDDDDDNDVNNDCKDGPEIKLQECITEDKRDLKWGLYTVEESVEEGQVKKEIYLEYVQAIGVKHLALFCLLYCCCLIFQFTSNVIVKQWTEDKLLGNTSLSHTDEYKRTKWRHFTKFAITGLFSVIFGFLFVIISLRGAFRAATILHHKLVYSILRCPLSFFNTTPSSRIICRFSKDVPRVDALGLLLRQVIYRFCTLCANLVMITIYCPKICMTLIIVSVCQFILYTLHSGSLRQIKRFKSKHRSPIYTLFSEILDGRSSIRAYRVQNRFIKIMEEKIDTFNNITMWENWVQSGQSMRFILQYRVVELVTCLICVMDSTMTAGMVGLVTMYAGLFCDATSNFLKLMIEVEMESVSLERVVDYTKKKSEAPWEIEGDLDANVWPVKGTVVFNNYKARHQDHSDLALKGINCSIQSGEKIGIVGRTGSGKTSLAMALFRLFEAADGKILIDGKNISESGLHCLRSSINVLPQDPIIFKGSLRMNLDPFGKSTDSELWRALSHAHLSSFVHRLPDELDFECGEGGNNLSMGQRQLLCLARTLIRKTKILVLDEATAAVDVETDELIQKTIATEFKECTVLTIAHRLNTVIDYDRILVLEDGLVKEFDSPKVLLKDKKSVFYSLAKDAKLVD